MTYLKCSALEKVLEGQRGRSDIGTGTYLGALIACMDWHTFLCLANLFGDRGQLDMRLRS